METTETILLDSLIDKCKKRKYKERVKGSFIHC